MISTLLAENAALVRILFWVFMAATAAIGWLLYRSGRSRALSVLAGAALAGTLVLTLSPSSNRASVFCVVQFSVPFQGVDTLANLAMLVPLTLFAALAFRRPLAVFAAVAGLSAAIELVQALLPDLGRACDTDDWFMNVVGAAMGTLAAIIVIASASRRAHPPRPRADAIPR